MILRTQWKAVLGLLTSWVIFAGCQSTPAPVASTYYCPNCHQHHAVSVAGQLPVPPAPAAEVSEVAPGPIVTVSHSRSLDYLPAPAEEIPQILPDQVSAIPAELK